jgi:SSS family solute:Na+ symporter
VHTILSVLVVTGYLVTLTFIAVRASTARAFEEFSLAGRTLTLPLVFGSLAATYVGPAFSIGFVGKGFKTGFLFLAIGLAYSLQNVMVGLFVAPRLRALKNCHTLGDVIGQKYDSKCQILAGIISVGLCAGFATVMAHAGGLVLSDTFGLPSWIAIFIIVAITALYTTFGGLRASVITDAFQFITFAILLPIALLFVLLFHLDGGATELAKQASTATKSGFQSMSLVEVAGLLTAFLLGETLIPPYANRALASKTTRVSRNGFALAGLFSIAWFIVMIALGLAAHGVIAADSHEDHVLLNLVKATMPPEGYVLLLVVLVSIVMSSLDSLLNAGAVAFTEDVVKPFVALPDSAALNIGRFATIAIAAIAAGGAVVVPSIIAGLLDCYTIWAPAILPALVIGLWVRRPRPLAGILSMITGSIVAILLQFVFPSAIHVPAILVALVAALLAYFFGYLLGQPNKEHKE